MPKDEEENFLPLQVDHCSIPPLTFSIGSIRLLTHHVIWEERLK